MNRSVGRLLRVFLVGVVLTVGQGGLASAASPEPSAPSTPTGEEMLSIVPSLVAVEARPGGTATAELTLRAAAPLEVAIIPRGLAQTAEGNFEAVPADEDASPYSARAMITASPQALTMEPGDAARVTLTVTVPPDAGEGTRYAILAITGLPADAAENVGFGVELGVSTLVTIAETAQVKSGEISDITVGSALPGQALPVTVSLANTGTTHFGAPPNEFVTTATLQDGAGSVIASGTTTAGRLSLVPTFVRDFALALEPVSPLVDGRYHLEVGVGLRDGTILDQKAMDFEWAGGAVLDAGAAPGIPPPTPGPAIDPLLLIAAILAIGAAITLAVLVARGARRQRPAGHGTGGA